MASAGAPPADVGYAVGVAAVSDWAIHSCGEPRRRRRVATAEPFSKRIGNGYGDLVCASDCIADSSPLSSSVQVQFGRPASEALDPESDVAEAYGLLAAHILKQVSSSLSNSRLSG